MTDVTLSYRGNNSLQFKVNDMLIWSIGFITMRPTDWSVNHSPFAQHVFQNGHIHEINISDAQTGLQFVTIRSSQDFTKEDEAKYANLIKEFVSKGAILDEDKLIEDANAVLETPHQDGSLESQVADYIENKFMPFIKEKTKHEAEIEFIRFYKKAENNYLAGVTLGSQCGTCATSVFTTLARCKILLGEFVKTASPGLEISGILVLPSSKGSPSLTFVPSSAPQ